VRIHFPGALHHPLFSSKDGKRIFAARKRTLQVSNFVRTLEGAPLEITWLERVKERWEDGEDGKRKLIVVGDKISWCYVC